MIRLRMLLLLGAVGAACSQDQVLTRPRALNRPLDMALACIELPTPGGAFSSPRVAPLPSCRGQATRTAGAIPSPNFRTLAFLSNNATGEVAVAGLSESTTTEDGQARAFLFDLDTQIPGYNFLPVGRLPTAIEPTSDGCKMAVLNEGSCDLSLIDVTKSAIGVGGKIIVPETVATVTPHTSAGPIGARPRTLAILPGATQPSGDPVCSVPSDYRALVAYPGCDLVAEIDLATGAYLRGIFVRADRVEDAGASPSCPIECDGLPAGDGGVDAAPADAPVSDAAPDGPEDAAPTDAATDGAPSDGGSGAAPLPPTDPDHARAISIAVTADHIFLAGTTSRLVWTVRRSDFSATSTELTSCPVQDVMPSAIGPRCNPLGVTRLRASPPPGGTPPNDAGQFVYAAALDRSLRVLRLETDRLRECETQADPQVVAVRWPPTVPGDPRSGIPAELKSCLPLDESTPAVETPPLRRGSAAGPGIRTSGAPIDIAFAQLGEGNPTGPTPLAGTFAYLVTSTGRLATINVDSKEARPRSNVPHQIHNGNTDGDNDTGGGNATLGGPRLGAGTLRQSLPGDVGVTPAQLPQLARIARRCPGEPPIEAIHWPDLVTVRPETWSFTFEGLLPNLARGGGLLGASGPDALVLDDPGARFCDRGAMPGDHVILASCQDDTACPPSQRCFGTISGRPGICLTPRADSGDTPLPRPECSDVIASRHEYRVRATFGTSLQLDERPLAVPRAGGCQSDADCNDVDLTLGGAHLFVAPGSRFVCDPEPWPGSTVRQCVLTCPAPTFDAAAGWQPSDAACQPNNDLVTNAALAGLVVAYKGYVCGQTPIAGLSDGTRRCVAGRIPRSPQHDPTAPSPRPSASDCFTEPLAYEVRAGHSFLITGSQNGYVHDRVLGPGGACISDPAAGWKRIGRLSYNVPACAAAIADGYDIGVPTGQVIGETPICVWDASKPPVAPNPCVRTDTSAGSAQLVWQMQNQQFEAAIAPAPPALFGSNYAFSFQVQGGFAPYETVTLAQLPSTLLVGPGPFLPGQVRTGPDWIYIVDSGDVISATVRTLLLGQLVRYDAQLLTVDGNTQVQ